MRFLIIIALLFFAASTFSQEEKKEKVPREKFEFGGLYRNTISIGAGGTSAAGGISFERFLSERWRLDIGIGYVGVGAGFQFFPWPIKRGTVRPHLNLSTTLQSWPGASGFQATYLGAGINWFLIKKININLDFGPSYFYHYWVVPGKDFPDRFFFMGNIKIGYRFSFYSFKRRKKYLKTND